MRTRTATLHIMSVDVICPDCGESVESSRGSYQWDITEIEPSQIYKCTSCGAAFYMPDFKFIKKPEMK